MPALFVVYYFVTAIAVQANSIWGQTITLGFSVKIRCLPSIIQFV